MEKVFKQVTNATGVFSLGHSSAHKKLGIF